jgi:hypothetical protein
MHAVTEFCCLSQQITLNQDCMPGHAWICMRIAGACMQRLASRQTWDPEPEFFSAARWVHGGGGGAAPRLATDGLPPTPLPRPRHLCGVRGCDRPQVPGIRGR